MKAINFFLKISGVERLNPFSKIQGDGNHPTPPPVERPWFNVIDRVFENMLFRNIFENNSIRCILDKTLRLMLFAIDIFLKN